MVPDQLQGVLQLPAVATEVLEAGQVPEVKQGMGQFDCEEGKSFSPAEVRTLLQQTVAAQSILQVGINLNSFVKLRTLDFHEGSRHGFHVGSGAAEGDPTTSDGIFVFVSVDTWQTIFCKNQLQ